MTKKTRRGLFYAMILIFIVVGITAIFYSNGWQLDPATLTIQKLGGIFFRDLPREASVQLDQIKFQFNAGILNSEKSSSSVASPSATVFLPCFTNSMSVTAQVMGSKSKGILNSPLSARK